MSDWKIHRSLIHTRIRRGLTMVIMALIMMITCQIMETAETYMSHSHSRVNETMYTN